MKEASQSAVSAIDEYPRAKARTLRFTCGAPRSARALGDGTRALFLRSEGPEELVNALWLSWFSADGAHHETLLADPAALLGGGEEDVPAEERARRERAREGGAGIVSYSVSADGRRIVFTLGGRLFMVELGEGTGEPEYTVREIAAGRLTGDCTPVLNPRVSPDGRRVLYTTGTRLIAADAADGAVREVAGVDDEHTQRIGLAEFVAGEEMDRYDGFWWAPDSRHAIVERFDSCDEPLWTIADPSQPFSYPYAPDDPHAAASVGARRYARALTNNAKVTLGLLDLDAAGEAREQAIEWDREAYEYVARVSWTNGHEPLLLVQNRRQTRDQVLAVDPADGSTRVLEEHANDQWIDIIDGTPAFAPDGRLVCALNDMEADTNRLTVDGRPFTPAGWNVRQVLDVSDTDVMCVIQRDPARDEIGVHPAWRSMGRLYDARCFAVVRFAYDGGMMPVTYKVGVWTASRAGKGVVMSGHSMTNPNGVMIHDVTFAVDEYGDPSKQWHGVIADHSATPGFALTTRFVTLPGEHGLLAAITVPSASSPYAHVDKLPVLMKPYGGPGHQEVVFNAARHWDSQWWADQGFIVVTADGRGTTGRGPAWDREIFENMKDVTLADQIEAVEGVRALAGCDGGADWWRLFAGRPEHGPVAGAFPDPADPVPGEDRRAPLPDLDRVSMIGWSYGGFLSALAVLDAPDVFKAACAGAPPTDWTLYDTHYTERYLGLDPAVYEHDSIVADAPKLRRPLMIIHGFADDNVTIAHSLRLSQALMAAGRPHTFLPLVGITHMTNDERVAENLLLLQRDFLQENL